MSNINKYVILVIRVTIKLNFMVGDDDVNTTSNSQCTLFPSCIPSITVVSSGSN